MADRVRMVKGKIMMGLRYFFCRHNFLLTDNIRFCLQKSFFFQADALRGPSMKIKVFS